jgi:putative N-acetylmannosamine-6-phosphate epimerase
LPRGALIVSCQATEENPLHGPLHMAAMARAAADGGAGGIRANGAADIAAIRAVVTLPLIGLRKTGGRSGIYITPDFAAAESVAAAEVIAIDATARPRPEPLAGLIARIHAELGRAVMADLATLEEGLAAEALGTDYLATTLAGYTEDRAATEGPDLELLEALVARCRAPVIAEGRFETASQVARAFALGAHAVVVGTAITNPREITRRLAAACPA